MTHRDEQWARDNFAQKYRVSTSGPASDVEQQVIGAVWGVNGYTTRAQADVLGDRLALSPASRLLDLGAGRGWPGLYLARRHGCSVVLADLPHEGLAIAMASARERGIDARSTVPRRVVRRGRAHRRAVLTVRQALRTESDEAGLETRRPYGVLHDLCPERRVGYREAAGAGYGSEIRMVAYFVHAAHAVRRLR